MKNLTIKTITFGSLLVTAAAHAENSVTLYGLIDTSIAFTHNDGGKNTTQMLGGNMQGPRWGLKGAEDLGGGLKTIFQLENGFSSTTGALGNGEFGRQAYVGISDATWGTVTAGRQYVPDTDLVQGITGDVYGAVFPTPGDVDNYDNDIRISNSVKYVSPTFGGLQGELLYAFGNQAGSIASGRGWGAALSYVRGPLSLAGSYQYYDGGNASAAQRVFSGAADSIFNSSVNAGYASAKSIKIARIATQYTFGALVAGASYSNAQYTADGASAFSTTEKYNTGNAFIAYNFNPALSSALGYTYTKSSGDSSAKYNQVSLTFDYNLSKRTDIYLVGAWQHATGQVRAADGSGLVAAQASIGSYGFSGANQTSQEYAALGIRHKF